MMAEGGARPRLSRLRTAYLIIAFSSLIASFIVITYTIVGTAVYGVQTGNYTATIYTNTYHEAWLEVVLFIVMIPGVIALFRNYIVSMKREGRQ